MLANCWFYYEYLKNIFQYQQICFAQEINKIKRHYACWIAVKYLAGVHEHDEPPPNIWNCNKW